MYWAMYDGLAMPIYGPYTQSLACMQLECYIGTSSHNMLLVNSEVFLNDFDVSCLSISSDTTLRLRVGTEDFRPPLWRAGEPYQAMDDLASLLWSFPWLLHTRTGPAIVDPILG